MRPRLTEIIGKTYKVINGTAWAAHGDDLKRYVGLLVRPYHVNKNGLIWVQAVDCPDMTICTPLWTLSEQK